MDGLEERSLGVLKMSRVRFAISCSPCWWRRMHERVPPHKSQHLASCCEFLRMAHLHDQEMEGMAAKVCHIMIRKKGTARWPSVVSVVD